jgi:hypothetical protein
MMMLLSVRDFCWATTEQLVNDAAAYWTQKAEALGHPATE